MADIRDDKYSGLEDLFTGRIANIYGNNLTLKNLTMKSARQAIEQSLASFNELHKEESPIEIEPNLIDGILNELKNDRVASDRGVVGDDEIPASYLQLVMWRIWDAELSRGSRRLRVQTFEELGGARDIVRTNVDRVLGALADDEREAAAEILTHLVTPPEP